MELGHYGWNQKINIFQQHPVFITATTPTSPDVFSRMRHGLLNLGDGGFDGGGFPSFQGNASGTIIGINFKSDFYGDLLSFQKEGLTLFELTAEGDVYTVGIIDTASYIHSTGDIYTDSSISASGNITALGISLTGSQSANKVLVAPDGSSGAPGWRILVAGDIPNLDTAKITSGTLALARGGTNTDNSSQLANLVWASPDGSTGAASYRSLSTTDLPPGLVYDNTATTLTTLRITGPGTLFRAQDGGLDFIKFNPAVNSTSVAFNNEQAVQAGTYFYIGDDSGSLVSSSGHQSYVLINPNVAQSGAATYTAFLVNVLESSLGSSPNYIADFQIGNISKANIDNSGKITSREISMPDDLLALSWMEAAV